jgi:glutamine amidotransferase
MADALNAMVVRLENLIKKHGIDESAYLNMVVTDGERMVGLRYVSNANPEHALSLYYSEGSRYECVDGACHMIPSEGDDRSMMIVSEKLTDFREDWKPVPVNNMILFYKDFTIKIKPVAV